MPDGYEELFEAIVIQACKDYRKTRKRIDACSQKIDELKKKLLNCSTEEEFVELYEQLIKAEKYLTKYRGHLIENITFFKENLKHEFHDKTYIYEKLKSECELLRMI